MATGNHLSYFGAKSNEPPTTAFATLDTRGTGHVVLDFDASTDEEAVFRGVMPATYAGGGITLKLYFMATSATSGNVVWQAAFERMSGQDADSDGFAAFQASGQVAANGTSGIESIGTITFTNGAQMDSVVAGDHYRLKIRRDADSTTATDDAAGDAEFTALSVRET
jgi:hypothetical protein